jgi:hypothetical protein
VRLCSRFLQTLLRSVRVGYCIHVSTGPVMLSLPPTSDVTSHCANVNKTIPRAAVPVIPCMAAGVHRRTFQGYLQFTICTAQQHAGASSKPCSGQLRHERPY